MWNNTVKTISNHFKNSDVSQEMYGKISCFTWMRFKLLNYCQSKQIWNKNNYSLVASYYLLTHKRLVCSNSYLEERYITT
jgi:hypothetical protein